MPDVSVKGIAVGALVVASGIAFSLFLAWAVVAATGAPPAGTNGAAAPRVEQPALQTVPHETLDTFLREKRSRLESAGPDHIPIEEAMRIVVARHRK